MEQDGRAPVGKGRLGLWICTRHARKIRSERGKRRTAFWPRRICPKGERRRRGQFSVSRHAPGAGVVRYDARPERFAPGALESRRGDDGQSHEL